MLLVHAASTFTLTTAQRDGMERAVTAWTRWAAARQGLDEAATEVVMTRLPDPSTSSLMRTTTLQRCVPRLPT